MRKRIWAVFLVLFVVGCLGLVLTPRVDLSNANRDRIEVGMTETEVEAILGGPPGDYSTRDLFVMGVETDGGSLSMTRDRIEHWCADEGFLSVGFDSNGRLTWTRFDPAVVLLTPVENWVGRRLL